MQRPSRKVISLIFLATAVVSWLFLQHLMTYIWVVGGIKFGIGWTVAAPKLIAAVLAVLLFFVLWTSEKTTTFIGDVILELSKVAWPNKKETILSTGVVSVLIAICAMILFFFDVIWGAVVRFFYQ